MNFRNTDLVETENFQFVRIHKNGNESVMQCIFNSFKKDEIIYTRHLAKKPRFCVIRDPYERFISGLRYDLFLNNVDIKDIDVNKLFLSNENHLRNSMIGHINHSVSQISYLMNTQIDHYIDIKDLNLFLKIHFKQTKHENNFTKLCKNKGVNKKLYNIEKYLNKRDIMKYLHLDYHIYNSIKASPFLWEWQHGKIF